MIPPSYFWKSVVDFTELLPLYATYYNVCVCVILTDDDKLSFFVFSFQSKCQMDERTYNDNEMRIIHSYIFTQLPTQLRRHVREAAGRPIHTFFY